MNDRIAGIARGLAQYGRMRKANITDIDAAREAGFPIQLLDFYTEFEPEDCLEHKQRIWSIQNALVENHDAVPGCALFPHGYVVFASTLRGDAYCIDTNITDEAGRHPIVIYSHEVIDEDATLGLILKNRVEVAGSLEQFLEQFSNGTLNEEPSYG